MVQSEHDLRLIVLCVVATSVAWEGFIWMALLLALLLLPWAPFVRIAGWFGEWIIREKVRRTVRGSEYRYHGVEEGPFEIPSV